MSFSGLTVADEGVAEPVVAVLEVVVPEQRGEGGGAAVAVRPRAGGAALVGGGVAAPEATAKESSSGRSSPNRAITGQALRRNWAEAGSKQAKEAHRVE